MAPNTAPLPTVTTTISATSTTALQSIEPSSISNQPPSSLEAKLVILGSQGVGKTSIVNRVIDPLAPLPNSSQATIGASFITKRIHDPDTNTTVRLQIWDTAGQERFRSISRLYYRGANVGLLCYDVTSEKSWEEMNDWLQEMKDNCELASPNSGGAGMVVHIVGTKTDLVAAEPHLRQVPFERTISYAAQHLGYNGIMPPSTSQSSSPPLSIRPTHSPFPSLQGQGSRRNSGFWTSDLGWDSCHEVSAKDNDGIEEVFRVIARKLVEQRNRKDTFVSAQTAATSTANQPGPDGDSLPGSRDRFGSASRGSIGSFRIGYGERRKSWLGLPVMGNVVDTPLNGMNGLPKYGSEDVNRAREKGRCC